MQDTKSPSQQLFNSFERVAGLALCKVFNRLTCLCNRFDILNANEGPKMNCTYLFRNVNVRRISRENTCTNPQFFVCVRLQIDEQVAEWCRRRVSISFDKKFRLAGIHLSG